jgi:SAM-dependent methyltransferase
MESSADYDEYSGIAEFYDYIVPYRDRQDVVFFVEMARQAGGPVLEIGCGTGRVLIPTAQAGIEIVGLDLSSSMLSICREKLSHESEEVQSKVCLVEADMRRFDLGQDFQLVTTPFRPFQHLMEVEDQLACLASIHRHLNNHGRLVLDLYNPDLSRLIDDKPLNEWEEEPEFEMPDGRKVTRRIRMVSRDLHSQVNEIELVHRVRYPDGRQDHVTQRIRMRHFFRYEVEHLLARSGFRIEQLYADYDRSPFGSKYPGELIVLARKK